MKRVICLLMMSVGMVNGVFAIQDGTDTPPGTPSSTVGVTRQLDPSSSPVVTPTGASHVAPPEAPAPFFQPMPAAQPAATPAAGQLSDLFQRSLQQFVGNRDGVTARILSGAGDAATRARDAVAGLPGVTELAARTRDAVRNVQQGATQVAQQITENVDHEAVGAALNRGLSLGERLAETRIRQQGDAESFLTKAAGFQKIFLNPKVLLMLAAFIGGSSFVYHGGKKVADKLFFEQPSIIKETSILSPKQKVMAFLTGRNPRPPAMRSDLHYNDDELEEINDFADTIKHNIAKGRPLPHALFWGPAGTGKTAFAKTIARSANADYIIIDAGSLLAGSMSDAMRAFQQVLSYGNSSSKKACIVFIDEADSVFGKRRPEGSSDIMQRITNKFLETTEKASGEKICFMLASNLPNALSSPVMNRMSRKIKFSAPTASVRSRILETYLKKFASRYNILLDDELQRDFAPLGEASDGLVGRDLEDVARTSLDRADRRAAKQLDIGSVLDAVRRKKMGLTRIAEDSNMAAYA